MKIVIADNSGAVIHEGSPDFRDGIRIGPGRGCDTLVAGAGIATEHLHLRLNAEGELTIQDLQSVFGIFIDGVRIQPGFVSALPPEGAVIKLSDAVTMKEGI